MFCILLLATITGLGQQRWWMDEPVRLIQTNLRETDAALDPARLVEQVAAFPANTLLFGMGGIVAYYPTKVEFHYPSPHLPPGRDLFGEVLREAHKRKIRVIGRFDLSKTQKAVYDAHPEWFFRRSNGEPVVYNSTYQTCINGGYYREHALRILAEALERYEVDGLFFNMFGNPSADYSGNPLGLCHCESCQALFRARYNRPLPLIPDNNYREFMFISSREVAAGLADLIHRKRPQAAFLTYIQEHVDGITSESNTSLGRPLPLWPYSASDNVNRARNSQPDKMAFNLCIGFVDIPYRFVSVPQAEIQIRLFQNMAHGAAPAFVVLGTMDQEDMSGLIAARPVFQWHARHEELYLGQESAARALLLGARTESYRGFFRLLSEQHIPFVVSDNLRLLESRPQDFDLVIAPYGAPAQLDRYLRQGGKVLAAGAMPPAIELPKVVQRWADTRSSYWRVRDHSLFPSLKNTKLLFLDGEYLELEPKGSPLLTLIPPSRFGPPEKVFTNKIETDKPGLLITDYGAGKLAYLPWDVGGLYYRYSSPGHGGLIADLIDHLLPAGRQLRTDAHPLVEITLMKQPKRGRALLHFINLSGHSDTAYFAPVEMRDIAVELAGSFHRAYSVRLEKSLPVSREGNYTKFMLPELESYDVLIVE